MAERQPEPFSTSADPTVQTFDHEDIANGIGYEIFYAATGTDQNLMLGTAIASNDIVTNIGISNATAEKKLDVDFDVEFNLARSIKGLLIVSVTHGIQADAGTLHSYIIAKVRKWDGTTETEIANNQSDTLDKTTGGAAQNSKTVLIEIPVDEIEFGSGETLRITIEQWGWADTGSGEIGFGHDPKGRLDDNAQKVIEDTDTTVLEVHSPFRIDR